MDQTETLTTTATAPKEALFVLGVHRSGTSALAGGLHLLGVNLGDNLQTGGPPSDTPGAFINQDIVLVHDILFRDLGCRWDMVGSLPEGWIDTEAADRAGGKLTRIVEQQLLGKDPWAVADPRLCRLMPLWFKVLEPMQIEPRLVHLVRHPHEVARSLNVRDNMDLFQGYLFWLVHNRDALRACSERNHVLLTYDQLLADPVTTLQSIATALRIDLPRDPVQCVVPLAEFIRSDHKHHHSSECSQAFKGNGFSQYIWVYDQFRAGQAKAMEAIRSGANSVNRQRPQGALPDFPLVVGQDTAPQVRTIRNHTVAMFNNLLEVIGRYEQGALDESQARLRRLLAATHTAETLYIQVYLPGTGDAPPTSYAEEQSKKVLLAPNEWQEVIIDIPNPEMLRTHRLRVDPLNTRGMAQISNIKLTRTVTGETLWAAHEDNHFQQIDVGGDGLLLKTDGGLEIICTGDDPCILLPLLPDLPDTPMQLRIWIKAGRRQTQLHTHWAELDQSNKELGKQIQIDQSQVDQFRQQVKTIQEQLAAKETASKVTETQIVQTRETLSEAEKALSRQQSEWQAKFNKQAEQSLIERNKVTEAQQQLDALKKALQAGEDAWQQEKAGYDSRIAHLDQRHSELEKAKADLEDRVGHLAEVTGQLELLKQNLQAREETWQQEKAGYDSRIAHLDQRHSELKKAKAALEDQVRHLEDISRQYFTELAISEQKGHRQAGINDTLKKDLEQQRQLTRKYHAALTVAEQEAGLLKKSQQENKQLSAWLRQLQNNFQALLSNHRWRIGKTVGRAPDTARLRSQTPMAVDHMQTIFDEFQKFRQPSTKRQSGSSTGYQKEGALLFGWMKQLQNNFKALIASRRWRIGNAALTPLERLLFRPRTPMAPDHIQEIFNHYERWRQNVFQGRSLATLTRDEIQQLTKWMRQLRTNHEALIASRRWRVGNATGRFFSRLALRRKKQMATDYMQQIFDEYEKKFG